MRYAGMYLHQPSGLYLTHYRFYDPKTTRWLNRDPIGYAGGLNLYGYVGNNPINLTDLSGLCPVCPLYGAYALAGALIGYYADTAIQLVENGGDIGALDGQQAAISAGIGMIPGVGVAKTCTSVAEKAITFSEHALLRMNSRGIAKQAVENILNNKKPFNYFHEGVWKAGFYDPALKIFVSVVDGKIVTVINKVKPQYIENLKRMIP